VSGCFRNRRPDVPVYAIIPVIGEFLDYMIKEFGMDEFDLVCNFNWGYFDGKPVVIDYGHNYFGENLEEVSL